MTTYIRHFIAISIVTVLMLAGTTGCQKDEANQVSDAAAPVKSQEDQSVAELLSALNMFRFEEPVKAPDFELLTVKGEKVSLSQYRGKAVLLSFWATW